MRPPSGSASCCPLVRSGWALGISPGSDRGLQDSLTAQHRSSCAVAATQLQPLGPEPRHLLVLWTKPRSLMVYSRGTYSSMVFRCWLWAMHTCSDTFLCTLCAERNPPIDEVIKQNVIPQFVTFLRRADMPQLQVCGEHRQTQGILHSVLASQAAVGVHPPTD